MKIKNTFVLILLTILALSIVTVLSSIFPIWGNIPINIVFPLIIVLSGQMVLFEKIKISTLIVGKILVALFAITLWKENWFIVAIVIMMYINVSEAVITDLKNKRYFSVLSGMAILATTFILFKYRWIIINQSDQGWVNIGYYNTNYQGILYWVIAYTIWNWNFVIGEFSPSIAKYHIAVLLTPLLLSLIFRSPGMWWILRASSLAFALVLQIRFKNLIENRYETNSFTSFIAKVNKKPIQIVLMLSVISLSIISLF